MVEVSYSELQIASNFSFLKGASHPEELIFQGASLGMKAIAITDVNSVTGLVRAHLAAKDAGIQLIIGAHLTLEEGLDLLIYPTNRPAYGRLTNLLTLGKRRAAKGETKLYLSDLDTENFLYGVGQVAIVIPPLSLFPRNTKSAYKIKNNIKKKNNMDNSFLEEGIIFKKQLECLTYLFKKSLYLSVTNHYYCYSNKRKNSIFEFSGGCHIPLVATNDVLMHSAARKPLLDVITCMRNGVTLCEAGYLLEANAERRLKSSTEMLQLFSDQPEVVFRTSEIAEQCQFSLDELSYEYPDNLVSAGSTSEKTLSDLVSHGIKKRYPNGIPGKVAEQIKYELRVINSLEFAPYFLTVYDIVKFANSRNIFCQGRGSAANSAVCYCLGITAVDPDRVELLFERFISAERGDPPDIDIDFESGRREEVIQYIYGKYGRENSGMTATVVKYRTKSAIREVGKVFGLSEDMISTLQKVAWRRSWEEIADDHIRETGIDPASLTIHMTMALAKEIRGFPRYLSQHTGGMVISNSPLCEIVPIANAAMAERTVIEWDKDDLDALGILKIDILALGMLTCIHKAFDLISKHYGKTFDLSNIPSEDPLVYEMLSQADSVGVFQVESRAQMSMLPRLKPRNFYDLVIQVAIVRPGPIQGDMVHPYLRRRNGGEKVCFPSKKLRAVLEKTLGIPLFQEQAMKIAIVAAGFTPQESDSLRRALSGFRHFDQVSSFKERFLCGMKKNGYKICFAEQCFNQIASFADYGFPESHAASFAFLVYISSWLKCYYPAVFSCALLNCQPMGFYSPSQLIRDARAHGIEVGPVCINASYWDCTLESGSNNLILRLGFRQIRGLRKGDAIRLIKSRNVSFSGISELYSQANLSKRVLTRLAQADVFFSIGLTRQKALWEIKGLEENNKLPLFPVIRKKESNVQLPSLSISREVTEDYKATSFSLKTHPLAVIRPRLESNGYMKCNILRATPNKKRIKVSGLVTTRQQPASAKGTFFITIEDESAIANLIVWPKIFMKFRHIVLSANIIGAAGKIQREGMVTHLLVEKLFDLSALIQNNDN